MRRLKMERPVDPSMNDEILRRLDYFFSSVRPSEFRDTLLEVYLKYLINEHHALPGDFERMAGQMYLFINLLSAEESKVRQGVAAGIQTPAKSRGDGIDKKLCLP